MTETSAVCESFWWCLYAYQTLIAGAFAVLIGGFTAWVIWRGASLPVRAQEQRDNEMRERRQTYGFMRLSAELQTLRLSADHARRAIGSVGLHPPNPSKFSVEVPPIFGDWETISLLPRELQRACENLAVQVHHYNRYASNTADWRELDTEQSRLQQTLLGIRDGARFLRHEAEAMLRTGED